MARTMGWSIQTLAGAVGGGVEETFGLSNILPGRRHAVTHRIGVRARVDLVKKQNVPYLLP